MKRTILVEFSFDDSWNEYEDACDETIMEDAIRELTDGVGFKIKTETK